MNFSETFKQSEQLCRFSPDGKYLASVVQFRLIVREVTTLQILHVFTCIDTVQHIEWSSDSSYVLCGLHKRGIVQVFSTDLPEWKCKIDEGSSGLVSSRFSPDGRHILTTADFQLRITVWSLLNKTVSYIKHPKKCPKAIDFSRNGQHMALIERRDCKDFISIFECRVWQLVKHFEVNTVDCAGLKWSPDGKALCVWESCLKYRVLIFSIDGQCLRSFSAYDHALGIKCVSWAPSSQFLALGSYDEKVRVLNHVTWKTIMEHDHPPVLDNPSVVIYKEIETRPQVEQNENSPPIAAMFSTKSKYDVIQQQVSIPIIKPNLKEVHCTIGVESASFSANNRYLLTQNENMPHALWIWDMDTLSQAVLLLQAAPIKCAKWDPIHLRLALCTGGNKIYMWSPAGALSVEVPGEASLQVNKLKWHNNGQCLLLMSKDSMCMCYFTNDSI